MNIIDTGHMTKFYVEPPWEWGTKVYIHVNGLGHITKMATMPIYGKNF